MKAGKVTLVGIGPGRAGGMTADALQAMEEADVLCGYTVYIDLVREMFPEKAFYVTSMTKERERCRWALETAYSGQSVALVCSGDAGVYGMAGLLLSMASEEENRPDIRIETVPGVTAATAGAAILGAPLMNDFCVISLSDRLTPWSVIALRLRAAAQGDFVICLYNPASRGRPKHLHRACKILLEAGKKPETICGWVRNIGRNGQDSGILTLEQLLSFPADMFTTVYIGSNSTRVTNGRIVTPRGYHTEKSRHCKE